MKNKLVLLIALLGIYATSFAQTFDLTTGSTGAPGSNDPIWTLRTPGTTTFDPVPISTGIIENGAGTTYPNAYVQNNCGQYISPWLHPSNNISPTPGTIGTYTYRTQFTVTTCNPTASLNLSFIAGDDEVTAIRVNGVAQPLAAGITHVNPGSLTSTPTVVTGVNTIEVDVRNDIIYTALQLCGNITVSGTTVQTPTNLNCCDLESGGELLSWQAVPGATSYELIITYNDPACCDNSVPGFSQIISVTDPYYLMTQSSSCFSWQVRAVYPNGCTSSYSKKKCGCGEYEDCRAPSELDCEGIKNQVYLTWASVSSAIGYEVEITYNDPACCDGGFPSSQMLSVTTNSAIFTPSTTCYSWRVRTICKNGSKSIWSGKKCSCKFIQGESEENTKASEVFLMKESMETSNTILLNLTNPTGTLNSKNCQLSIFNMSGVMVYDGSIVLDEEKELDISAFKTGVYICKVMSNGKVITTEKLSIVK